MAARICIAALDTPLPRARLLVEELCRRTTFDVIADSSVGGAETYDTFKFRATCVVLVWGRVDDEPPPYWVSSDRRSQSPVVIAKIRPGVRLPEDLHGVEVFELGNWAGGAHPELDRMMRLIERLADHRLPRDDYWGLDESLVDRAVGAVAEIRELTKDVYRLDDVLGTDSAQAKAIASTLGELSETYRVVKSAIQQFFAAGLGPKGIDGDAYAFLERGTLAATVRNGRAHCLRIGTRYYREGGIRQALVPHVDAEFLDAADTTFAVLTNSDMDMLAQMDAVGEALTTEAREVVVLLLTGQESAARERIVRARDLLLPLEAELDAAIAAFQEIGASLGYAENQVEREGGTHVTMNVSIGGGNVGCNIVVAEMIKDSAITIAAPGVSDELRGYLTDLHKAVAELSTQLSDDEALLAARDLRDLTEQATSGQPKEVFWRRAANGLLEAAKRAAETGIPVVDLVAKVIALLS